MVQANSLQGTSQEQQSRKHTHTCLLQLAYAVCSHRPFDHCCHSPCTPHHHITCCTQPTTKQGRLLGIRDEFTTKVAQVAIDLSGPCDPQVGVSEGVVGVDV